MAKTRSKAPNKVVAGSKGVGKKPQLAPDWRIVGLALFGVLLTGYLFFVSLSGGSAAFCTAGSSCDVVQQSRWSTLFGLPITLWGLVLYGAIAMAAATGRTPAARWRNVATLSLVGIVMSLYLNVVAGVALSAVCAWCLLSLLVIGAIFVLTMIKRPTQTPAKGWKNWASVHAIVLVPAMLVIGAAQAGWLSPPADPRLEALATHLESTGAKYYGAYWCPNCVKQRKVFGRAADDLPYVECSPNGPNGAVAFECASQSINSFPTWIISGKRYQGLLTPEELARYSNFAWNAPKWNKDVADKKAP